eukprot:6174141-Pleurochrysis_carterae.AAC.3
MHTLFPYFSAAFLVETAALRNPFWSKYLIAPILCPNLVVGTASSSPLCASKYPERAVFTHGKLSREERTLIACSLPPLVVSLLYYHRHHHPPAPPSGTRASTVSRAGQTAASPTSARLRRPSRAAPPQ